MCTKTPFVRPLYIVHAVVEDVDSVMSRDVSMSFPLSLPFAIRHWSEGGGVSLTTELTMVFITTSKRCDHGGVALRPPEYPALLWQMVSAPSWVVCYFVEIKCDFTKSTGGRKGKRPIRGPPQNGASSGKDNRHPFKILPKINSHPKFRNFKLTSFKRKFG